MRESSQRSARATRARAAGLMAVVAVVTVLMGAVGLSIFFARQTYLQLMELRLDPLGLEVHAGQIAAAAASKATPTAALVLFGDSRVAMWAAPEVMAGYQVVNLGVGYQTTAQASPRFDREVPTFHPQVILIELGANDLRALPFFPEDRTRIISTCKSNLKVLVAKGHALGAHVVLSTIFPLGHVPWWRRLLWPSAPVSAAIDDVNAFIRTLASPDVTVFEAAAVLASPEDSSLVRPEFQSDYIHETPTAYRALNEHLIPMLQRLRGDNPQRP